MNQDGTKDEDRLKKAVSDLSEWFDTVQIFVTRYEGGDDGGTLNLGAGDGNYFARRGQVEEWLMKANEEAKIMVRKREDE